MGEDKQNVSVLTFLAFGIPCFLELPTRAQIEAQGAGLVVGSGRKKY